MTTASQDFAPTRPDFAAGAWRAVRAGAGVAGGAARGAAQGRLDARYEATLAGIPVGKGAWTIEISDDQFSAAASGGTAGLLKAFAGGTGTSASQGRIVNGALVPEGYVATTTTSKKSETIRMALVNGNVKEFVDRSGAAGRSRPHSGHRRASPRRLRSDDRLDAAGARHRRSDEPGFLPHRRRRCSTAGCATISSSISSGMETVKAEKGYHGPAVVCAIYFTPVVGLHPGSPRDQISRRPAQHGDRASRRSREPASWCRSA